MPARKNNNTSRKISRAVSSSNSRSRSRNVRYHHKKSKKIMPKWIFYLICVVMFFGIMLYVVCSSVFWDSGDKLPVVIQSKDSVYVAIFDPVSEEISSVRIPGNTQVEVSRRLGTWRLGTVWELGENEGVGGELLAETVTRDLKLPVVAWESETGMGFLSGNPFEIFMTVLRPHKTNLAIGDRLRIAFFAVGVKNTDRFEYDLEETSYLSKTVLADGQEGYVARGEVSPGIVSLFVDGKMSQNPYRVRIKYATERSGLAENVGKVLEVLGAKVASITALGEDIEQSCLVVGKDKEVLEKISTIFGCGLEVVDDTTEGFDIEMTLGSGFDKKY